MTAVFEIQVLLIIMGDDLFISIPVSISPDVQEERHALNKFPQWLASGCFGLLEYARTRARTLAYILRAPFRHSRFAGLKILDAETSNELKELRILRYLATSASANGEKYVALLIDYFSTARGS